MTAENGDSGSPAIVLDHLPRGRPDDDRPAYRRSPVVQVVRAADFQLFEAALDDEGGTDVSIGDPMDLEASFVERARRVDFDELSGGGRSELEYAVATIIDSDGQRFVDHFNDAQPITLRLHQLDLLPGIGEKLRNTVLDERKREPFDSFADLEQRVDGLHDPDEILADRILEELREEDLKYRSFVRREE